MVKLITLIILLIPTWLFGQSNDQRVVSLINHVYKDAVPSRMRYYYLHEKADNLKFDKKDLLRYFNNDTTLFENLPLDELTQLSLSDTSSISWEGFVFEKARIVDLDHLPKYGGHTRIIKPFTAGTPDSTIIAARIAGVLPVIVKKGSSEKQINEQIRNLIRKLDARPEEEKNSYFFSKPLLSKDGRYGIIQFSDGGWGCTYVLKFDDGKWRTLFKYHCWVT